MHTGERIAWFPTRPASMFIGRLPPRDKALDDLMYAKPEAVEAATGRALEAPPEPAPVLTGPEAIAAAKEVDAKRARRLLGEIRPDVMHSHSSKAGILARKAAATVSTAVRRQPGVY